MASTVDYVLDQSMQGYGCRSIGGLNSWRGCLVTVLSLQFVAFNLAICKAAQPPTIAELRQAHSQLRTDSIEVQGDFRVYRSETVILAALEKLPADIGIPLVRSGYVWRSAERFRVDYKLYRRDNGTVTEVQQAYAHDVAAVYELSSGLDPDGGMLSAYNMNTPEGANSMASIKSIFYGPLDSLWSGGGGEPILDVLQRPGTIIAPNKSRYLPGGFSLLVPPSRENNETQIEFEPTKNYPFGYLFSSVGEGSSLIKIERRVVSVEKDGRVFPSRVVDVVSYGSKGGYTQVVMLDLEPLAADSPISVDITPASFQNLGFGYQVYDFREPGKEELAQRYERPTPIPAKSESTFRSYFLWYFLWINGFVILVLLAYVIFRYRKKSG